MVNRHVEEEMNSITWDDRYRHSSIFQPKRNCSEELGGHVRYWSSGKKQDILKFMEFWVEKLLIFPWKFVNVDCEKLLVLSRKPQIFRCAGQSRSTSWMGWDKAALAEGSGNEHFHLVMPVTEGERRSGQRGHHLCPWTEPGRRELTSAPKCLKTDRAKGTPCITNGQFNCQYPVTGQNQFLRMDLSNPEAIPVAFPTRKTYQSDCTRQASLSIKAGLLTSTGASPATGTAAVLQTWHWIMHKVKTGVILSITLQSKRSRTIINPLLTALGAGHR